MPVYCILPNCYVWPWLINLTESRSGNQEIVETRTQNRKTSTCTEQLLLLLDHFPELEERKETKRAAAAYNELVGVGGGGTDAVGAGELGLAVEAPLPGAAVRARGAGVAHLNSAEIGEAQDEIPRMDSHESRKRRGFFSIGSWRPPPLTLAVAAPSPRARKPSKSRSGAAVKARPIWVTCWSAPPESWRERETEKSCKPCRIPSSERDCWGEGWCSAG